MGSVNDESIKTFNLEEEEKLGYSRENLADTKEVLISSDFEGSSSEYSKKHQGKK